MTRKIIINVFKYLALCVLVVMAIGPLFYMLNTSMQETSLVMGAAEPEYTIFNYIKLITQMPFLRWMLNSLIFAGSVVILIIFIDTLAGYALARYRFAGRGIIFGLILASMMLPMAVLLFPLFFIVLKMGLIDTYPGLILPLLAPPFGIFLMRQFMLTIPLEIIDAAKIDGCSEFGVLYRIIFPLVRPAQAILAIVVFLSTYSNFIWPLIVIKNRDMFTLTLGLARIPTEEIIDWGLVAAGSFLTMVPLIIVFLIFQKQFMEALTRGAVKG